MQRGTVGPALRTSGLVTCEPALPATFSFRRHFAFLSVQRPNLDKMGVSCIFCPSARTLAKGIEVPIWRALGRWTFRKPKCERAVVRTMDLLESPGSAQG